jgi:hypothetical protein
LAARHQLTHFVGDEIAITVHGTAVLLGQAHPEVAALERIYVDLYGSSPFGWAEGVVLVPIEPDTMYAYAPDPSRVPSRLTRRDRRGPVAAQGAARCSSVGSGGLTPATRDGRGSASAMSASTP